MTASVKASYGNSRENFGGHAGLHPKLLSVAAVADLLGLSRNDIFAFLRRGEIGYVRIGQQAIRISERQLIEYLQQDRGSPNGGVGGGRRRLHVLPFGARR